VAGTTPASASTSAAQAQQASQPQQAKVGSSLTLSESGGDSLAVTVDQVMDPLSVGSFDQATAGHRYVGVQITLKNVGSVPYSDSPSNGSTLLSNTNEQAQGTIVSGGPCGNDFQSSVKIAPGGSEQGCIPFELADGQSPETFQFTLDSGFANQTGQWSLAGASTASTNATPTPAASTDGSAGASSSDAATQPLAALTGYWQSIDAHRFGAAYAYLAPGSVSQSKAQFVSQEQHAGIQSATFSGNVTSNTGSAATVTVVSLTTNDTEFGCRNWAGSYQLSDQNGQWLVEQAHITPSPCG
jgi:hypothetical protein